MDWLTFSAKLAELFVRLCEAALWPAVAAFAVWASRARIGPLMDRLENVEGWGAKVKFGRSLDRVEAVIPPVPKDPVIAMDGALPPPTATASRTVQISGAEAVPLPDAAAVSASPSTAVVRSYELLKHALAAALQAQGIDVSSRTPAPRLAQELDLPPQDIEAIRELRMLRNQAVHDVRANIKATDAQRYVDVVAKMAAAISKMIS